MKNIVILSAFLTPMRSGAEACAEEVPLALASQYDFTIVTAKMRKDLPSTDKLQGKIPVIRVGFGYTFDKWLFPFLAPSAVAKLKPDVVHAVLETFAGLALVFCRAPKKILTCQTTNRSFLKGFIVRKAHQVTCISRTLLQTLAELGRTDVHLISNGINSGNLSDATLRTERVAGRILFVGRLERMKGIDTLLTAVAGLKTKNWQLKIVGDGSLKKVLLKLTTDLGIKDRVEFLGYISPEDVSKEYAAAEIFCGLSRSEALGNVFLEAQAAGCAVIGTSVGGIPDIIEREVTGIIVPPNDAVSATKALERVLSDSDLRYRIIKGGTSHAQQFDWSVIARQYAKLY
jgi:glycosyltransferase involved in cell wall biosynthesis